MACFLELIKTAQSPAPQRFRECAVLTWAIPQVAGAEGKRSVAVLPAAWYDITNWDNDGKPESTRYRWRSNIRKALDDQVNEALTAAQELLDTEGLIESCAAWQIAITMSEKVREYLPILSFLRV